MKNRAKSRKQRKADKACALDTVPKSWRSVDWDQIRKKVRRLQMRIAKAVQQKRWNKVKILQRTLVRSLSAKLWAVKRVTTNRGKRTPGVDNVLWRTEIDKMQAVTSLKRRGYRAKPLRRILIPKKNGKMRPLSIPTMKDRAMQALYQSALAPVAETIADPNSYGFREGRSCHDAIQAAFNALSKPNSARWVLEGDIKGCFDNFSHQWMIDHVPLDKLMLRQWLKAGFVYRDNLYPSDKGAPQGGVISPTLSNLVLDGLEKAIRESVPRTKTRVNFVRYADDFIVTAKSRQLLETSIKPTIEAFLAERGLELSQEKTVVTHVAREGFTFLGQTFRKRGNTLRITPSKAAEKSIIAKLGELMHKHVSSPAPALIKALNQTLRGWGNYHKHVVSSGTFARIDTYVFKQLWRLLRKRHPNKSKNWLIKRYWKRWPNTATGSGAGEKYRFSACGTTVDGRAKVYKVMRLTKLPRSRYVKIKAHANPYLWQYAEYFYNRRHNRDAKALGALSAREYRKQQLLPNLKLPGRPRRAGLQTA